MVYVALSLTEGLPSGSVEMNLPAKQGTIGDSGSSLIPGSGRFPQKGMATHSSTLSWRIPWAEEPGGLQSRGLQSQTQLKQLSTYAPYLRERSDFCISEPSVVITICSVNAEIRVTS